MKRTFTIRSRCECGHGDRAILAKATDICPGSIPRPQGDRTNAPFGMRPPCHSACALQVVLDNDPDTHWSRYGLHQWLEFHLDSPAGVPTIEAIDIQFFQGSSRIQFFEVSVREAQDPGPIGRGRVHRRQPTASPPLFRRLLHCRS